jgi:hypothetical protein
MKLIGNKRNLEKLASQLLSTGNINGNAGMYMTIEFTPTRVGSQHYMYPITWYDAALKKFDNFNNVRVHSIDHILRDDNDVANIKSRTIKLSNKQFRDIVIEKGKTIEEWIKKEKAIGSVVTCDNMMNDGRITLIYKK